MVAYCMNEYSVITYAFKEKHLKECIKDNRFTENFRTISNEKDLYDYMRVEEIKELSKAAGLERMKLITPDGPANYLRPVLNQMDEEEFDFFINTPTVFFIY